jgi:large subunit ribosomal protein L9
LALEVTKSNEDGLKKRMCTFERRDEVVASKTSILAERIKTLKPVLKAKIHDGEKLYASVNAQDVLTLLALEGVKVAKNQVIFEKTIKTKGSHSVIIKLSNTLQPSFILKVVAE